MAQPGMCDLMEGPGTPLTSLTVNAMARPTPHHLVERRINTARSRTFVCCGRMVPTPQVRNFPTGAGSSPEAIQSSSAARSEQVFPIESVGSIPHILVTRIHAGVKREIPTAPGLLRHHRALPRSTRVSSVRTTLLAETLLLRHSFTADGQHTTCLISPAHRMLMWLVWTLQTSPLAAKPRRRSDAIPNRTTPRLEFDSAIRRQTSRLPIFTFTAWLSQESLAQPEMVWSWITSISWAMPVLVGTLTTEPPVRAVSLCSTTTSAGTVAPRSIRSCILCPMETAPIRTVADMAMASEPPQKIVTLLAGKCTSIRELPATTPRTDWTRSISAEQDPA